MGSIHYCPHILNTKIKLPISVSFHKKLMKQKFHMSYFELWKIKLPTYLSNHKLMKTSSELTREWRMHDPLWKLLKRTRQFSFNAKRTFAFELSSLCDDNDKKYNFKWKSDSVQFTWHPTSIEGLIVMINVDYGPTLLARCLVHVLT